MSGHKLRSASCALLAVIGLGWGAAAHAQTYVGLSGGASDWQTECPGFSQCSNIDGSGKVFIGHRFKSDFGIEASYVSLGRSVARDGPWLDDMKASGVEIVGLIPIASSGNTRLFFKGGVSFLEAKRLSGGPNGQVNERMRSAQPVIGFGLSQDFSRHVSGRVEWEERLVDLPGDSGPVSNFTLGLQVNF